MMANASPGPVAKIANSTGVVITSRTGFLAGSSPLSAILRNMSRSVKMPATRFWLSMIATAPTCRSSMRRTASATLASTETAAASGSHISRTLMVASVHSAQREHHRRHRRDLGIMNRSAFLSILFYYFSFSFKDIPVLHHKLHIFKRLDVPHRIAVDRNDIGIGSGCNHADLSLHVEHFCRP